MANRYERECGDVGAVHEVDYVPAVLREENFYVAIRWLGKPDVELVKLRGRLEREALPVTSPDFKRVNALAPNGKALTHVLEGKADASVNGCCARATWGVR